MTIQQDLQRTQAMSIVELFELDATSIGGDLLRFHNGKNGLGSDVVWQGNTYTAFPIEAEGFEFSGRGQLPRPVLRVANVTGLLGALVRSYQDLVGCKLTRKRTLEKYLDSVNSPVGPMPGPTVEFTRASTGTYWGSDGLLKTAAVNAPRFQYDPAVAAGVTGPQLAPPTSSLTGWSGAGTSPSLSTNGTAVTVTNGGSGEAYGATASIVTAGKTYKVDVTMLPGSVDGSVTLGGTRLRLFLGVNTYYIRAASNGALLIGTNSATAGHLISFSGLSVQEAVFTPRGLLVEESRTNLITNSATFQPTGGGPTFGTYAVDQVAPDGTVTASRVVTASSREFIQYGVANGTYTFSVFARVASGTRATSIDLKDNSSDTVRGSTSVTLTTAWQRVAVSGTTSGGVAGVRIEINAFGVGDVYWGAQLEVGASASSYIPTTTAAVTRAADVPKLTGTNFSSWYNAAAGTFVVGYSQQLTSSTTRRYLLNCNDAGNNRLALRSLDNAADYAAAAIGYGTGVATIASAVLAGLNTASRVAFAYGSNSAIAQGGTLGGVDANANSVVATSLDLGQGLGSNQTQGHILSLRYYPARLSNADLQTLSAGGSVTATPAMDINFTTGTLQTTVQGNYNPLADPSAALPDDVYFIDRKAAENKVLIEFELAAAFDVAGVQLPRRYVVQNVCPWAYRGGECGYTGTAYFDRLDAPVGTPAADVCGKRLGSCKIRFGEYAELPFGGFPAAGLVR